VTHCSNGLSAQPRQDYRENVAEVFTPGNRRETPPSGGRATGFPGDVRRILGDVRRILGGGYCALDDAGGAAGVVGGAAAGVRGASDAGGGTPDNAGNTPDANLNALHCVQNFLITVQNFLNPVQRTLFTVRRAFGVVGGASDGDRCMEFSELYHFQPENMDSAGNHTKPLETIKSQGRNPKERRPKEA
jgi:hypothetical protein